MDVLNWFNRAPKSNLPEPTALQLLRARQIQQLRTINCRSVFHTCCPNCFNYVLYYSYLSIQYVFHVLYYASYFVIFFKIFWDRRIKTIEHNLKRKRPFCYFVMQHLFEFGFGLRLLDESFVCLHLCNWCIFSQCFYLIVDRIIELQRDVEYKVIVDENSGLTLDMYVMRLCTDIVINNKLQPIYVLAWIWLWNRWSLAPTTYTFRV